jgi:VRR-NUC domain
MKDSAFKKPEYTGTQLQGQIIDYAHIKGWKVAHFRPAMNRRGQWRTAVSADGKGFPDLLLIRPPQVLALECKSEHEKVRPDQEEWIRLFHNCDKNINGLVIRPSDWSMIQTLLE